MLISAVSCDVCAPVYIDMVEVGGSNPPGPTKHKRARSKRAFFDWTFTTLSDWRIQSKNATVGPFSPPEQRKGTRRVQSPEAMAIEDHLAGPTKV